MKVCTRFLTFMLILAMAAGMMTAPARADVMTIGVYFRGIQEQADGTTALIPLSGSFRVTQGGMDRGVIQAGESTLNVDGTDSVTILPMAETIPAGWDLSDATVTVDIAQGGNVNVPILVHPMTEKTMAAASAAQAVTLEAAKPEETETAAATGAEETESTEAETGAAETVVIASTNGEDGATAGQPVYTTIAATLADYTPVPTAKPTPAPTAGTLAAGEGTGTFHIKAFYDSNNNGDCGVYEVGVADVAVYIVNEAGEVITGGSTNADGEIRLPGIQPGAYRVRVWLTEKWGFNKKASETGLNKSIMNFSAEAEQDSEIFTLSAGETIELGVGLLKGVTVDGICWLDENGDGIMGSEEPRIAGARITLAGQKNGLIFEAYSDENGYWKATRLRPGSYDFTSYAPDGMMFTRYSKTGGTKRSVFTTEGKTKLTKTLDLNDGKNEPNQNIGFAWQASVSGIAFLDANYNGLYDEGEKPLAGVKVTAIKQIKDEEIAVAYTDEDGRYTLGGLRGNTYKIRALLPDDGSNFTRTTADPLGNQFVARSGRRENFWKDFVITDGSQYTVNVGAIYYGSVSGTVYMDDDFSATRNGNEKVAQGIDVTLLDAAGNTIDKKITTPKGAYTFTGLTPGKYSLRMTAKSGYAFTKAGEGNVMLNLNGGEGYSEPFEVPLGENVTGMDAGMIRPGTVKGTVFADENDNGQWDSGEPGLAGTTVRLMSEAGAEFSATVSQNGEFLFDAVMPGRYYLEYALPEGAIFAKAGGDSAIQGDNGIGRGEWFDFRTGDEKTAALCGGLTLGKISGIVFHDPEGSGTMEEDAALAGARITMTPSRGDLEEIEATTDESGAFEIRDLHPDTWRMRITMPEGMVTTWARETTLPIQAGMTTQESTITIAMGEKWENQRIGAAEPGTIRGRFWLDENNNGIMDPGEQTPAGQTLTMTNEESGEIFATMRTDAEGVFEHSGVVPGSYTISYQMDEDSDAPIAGDCTFEKDGARMTMTGIAFAEGDTREDLRLGVVRYTTLGGQVWIDLGKQKVTGIAAVDAETATDGTAEKDTAGSGTEAAEDAGEDAETAEETESGTELAPAEERDVIEPLSGAEVWLTDGEGTTIATTTTQGDGHWKFTGLMPGEYRIETVLPEGVVVAEPDDERLETGLISIMRETDGRTGRSDIITVTMGQDQMELNFGGVQPGAIGDYCWLDENGNGWQDGGEMGIPNVKVELVRNGKTVAETETDQYGLYFFRDVYPAVYTLRVTAPEEVRPTQKKTDIYLIVSSLIETEEETAETEEFTVASNSNNFNVDLGYVLRQRGVYPEGYGEQETQDWSRTYENSGLR